LRECMFDQIRLNRAKNDANIMYSDQQTFVATKIRTLHFVLRNGKSKSKVFPYSLPSVGPGAGVQAVSPQVT